MKTEPLHIFHNRVDVLRLLFLWIRVVETQVSVSAKFVCQTEVQADCLGVSNVQISVWLRRETCLHPAAVLIRLQIFDNDVANEVRSTRFRYGHATIDHGIRLLYYSLIASH